MNVHFHVLLVACALQLACGAYNDIKTTAGWVRGETCGQTEAQNRTIYCWKSIPYAEPPVGHLRFEAPVPKVAWSGIFDARHQMSACVQGNEEVTGKEDCLYLKIFTTTKPGTKKLPVLVWIHGGAFWSGGVDFNAVGVDHILNEDVIVVGVQYRLGALGFLSTGDTVIPGNNGLRDQILSLKWIKANIQNFGGDPNKITVAGQSAGGASVGYILQSQQAKGLFSKAILMSGDPLCLWSKCQASVEIAKKTASNLKLSFNSTHDLAQKLKTADIVALQQAAMSARNSLLIGKNPRDGLVFVPVIEPEHPGAIITKKSYEQLASGNFAHIPIMAGFTSYELNFESLSAIFRLYLLKYDLNTSLLAPSSLNAGSRRFRAGLSIKSKYFGLSTVANSPVKTSKFISDDQFVRPITKAVQLYSAKVPVYFYQFSYLGELGGKHAPNRVGPEHSEELAYLKDFPHPGTAHDYVVKNRMVRMWANFVKTGNPTPAKDPLLNNLIWPANTGHAALKCLDINKELSVIGTPNESKVQFWEDLYHRFGNPPYDTY